MDNPTDFSPIRNNLSQNNYVAQPTPRTEASETDGFVELEQACPQAAPPSRSLTLTESARNAFAHMGISLKDMATKELAKASVYQAKVFIDSKQVMLLKHFLDLQPELKAVKSKTLAEHAATGGFTESAILLIDKQIDRLISALSHAALHGQHPCFVALIAHGLETGILPPYDTDAGQALHTESLVQSLFDAIAEKPMVSEAQARATVQSFDHFFQELLPRLHVPSLRAPTAGEHQSTQNLPNQVEAVKAIQKKIGRLIIDKPISSNNKQTLFHLMAQYGTAQSMSWCLAAGADPWQKDAFGQNAFELALSACNEDTLSELTYRRPEKMLESDQAGNTLFHLLAKRVEDKTITQVTDLPSAEEDFIEVQNHGSMLETGEVNTLRLMLLERCLNAAGAQALETIASHANSAGQRSIDIAQHSKSPTAIYLLSNPTEHASNTQAPEPKPDTKPKQNAPSGSQRGKKKKEASQM